MVVLALFALAAQAGVSLRLIPHDPPWVEAFFIARGLPEEVAHALSRRCVFQVHVENRGHRPVRVRTDAWKVEALREVRSFKGRSHWASRLGGLSPAARASLLWALFPDRIALQPGEGMMGLVILDLPPGTPFVLDASWDRGQKRLSERCPAT